MKPTPSDRLGGRTRGVIVCWLALVATFGLVAVAQGQPYFGVRVGDPATGRGVPLVKVRVGAQDYYTDSAGLAAVNAATLANQTLGFQLSSYGYESGIWPLQVTPGVVRDTTLARTQRAERLYRVTGKGIYQDSVRLGQPTPITQPLLNANVRGQDSVQATVYKGKIRWFWGDTLYDVGFGNFRTAGATSALPGQGSLDPSVGVNLNYFVAPDGSAKQMMPLSQPGPVWIDGLFTITDDTGQERLLTHYSRRDPNNALGAQVEHGLAIYNDSQNVLQRHQVYPLTAPISAVGHSFEVNRDGQDYLYFALSYPNVRVKKNWGDVNNPSQWEAFTPFVSGARYNAASPPIERDSQGKPVYGWKKNTDPMTTEMLEEMVQNGHLNRSESPFRWRDDETGDPVKLHRASVYWNDYRNSWVMIGTEFFGDSLLGETWFSEAPSPEGPWENAIKVVTHHNGAENYSFYNPKQHPFFDQEGGRFVYFEGTYTESFSGNPTATPLYDYNQVMYRLDLATIPPMFTRLAGDYNLDGRVDAADYTVWRDTRGSTTDLRANGDNTGASIGVVDAADEVVWREHYGDVAGPTLATPEPTAWSLVVLGGVLYRLRRSRSRLGLPTSVS